MNRFLFLLPTVVLFSGCGAFALPPPTDGSFCASVYVAVNKV